VQSQHESNTHDTDTESPAALELSDVVIVERVLAGEVELFRILVDRYQRPVYRLGFRFFRAVEDVEDYVQDVFLKAYLRLSQFCRRGRFYSWLMRIAYTHGIDRSGRKKSLVTTEYLDSPDPRQGTEETALRSLAREELRAAVADLPQPAGACVDLFFFFELTHKEVSRIVGIRVNTVKSHICRAKRRLRERLANTQAEAYYEV